MYTVSLEGEELHTKMVVHNTGDKAFDFTGSLHTYFGVADIESAAVGGLKGVEYLDRVSGFGRVLCLLARGKEGAPHLSTAASRCGMGRD